MDILANAICSDHSDFTFSSRNSMMSFRIELRLGTHIYDQLAPQAMLSLACPPLPGWQDESALLSHFDAQDRSTARRIMERTRHLVDALILSGDTIIFERYHVLWRVTTPTDLAPLTALQHVADTSRLAMQSERAVEGMPVAQHAAGCLLFAVEEHRRLRFADDALRDKLRRCCGVAKHTASGWLCA